MSTRCGPAAFDSGGEWEPILTSLTRKTNVRWPKPVPELTRRQRRIQDDWLCYLHERLPDEARSAAIGYRVVSALPRWTSSETRAASV